MIAVRSLVPRLLLPLCIFHFSIDLSHLPLPADAVHIVPAEFQPVADGVCEPASGVIAPRLNFHAFAARQLKEARCCAFEVCEFQLLQFYLPGVHVAEECVKVTD